jgi:hypothetical protein
MTSSKEKDKKVPTSETPKHVEAPKRYETREAKISAIIANFISTLPNAADWKILAIDLNTDTLVVKREVK